jgi:hypothetical protein
MLAAPSNKLVALGAQRWRDLVKGTLLAQRLPHDGGEHRNVVHCDVGCDVAVHVSGIAYSSPDLGWYLLKQLG